MSFKVVMMPPGWKCDQCGEPLEIQTIISSDKHNKHCWARCGNLHCRAYKCGIPVRASRVWQKSEQPDERTV